MDNSIVILLSITLIAFFVCVFLAWYFTYNARLKERLLLIEKGLNPDDFLRKTENSSSPLLKLGIIFIGLSLGMIVASTFFIYSDSYTLGVMGLFAGGSMIVANYANKFKNRQFLWMRSTSGKFVKETQNHSGIS